MESLVQLVFRGEVLDGFGSDAVKRSLTEMLKLDDAKQARLFSGKRTVVKRSVTPAEAQRYVKQFAKVGARLHVEPADTPESRLPTIVPSLLGAPLVTPPATPKPPPPPPAAPLALLPVATKAEEQIVCPNCGETQSKRILCRSCATDMPMGIAAKIEAEQEARAARLDAWRAKRGLGPAGQRVKVDDDAPGLWGLGFSGRMARLPYVTGNLLLMAAIYLLLMFLVKQPTGPRLIAFGLAGLATGIASLRLGALRLQDFNVTPWLALLFPVPIVGVVLGLVMIFMPGTDGDNDYGGPPRPGHWLFVLLSLGALGVSIGMSWSWLKDMAQDNTGWQSMDFLSKPTTGSVPTLPSEAATAAYRNDYLPAPAHKAFAVAPDGSWGWMGGAPSLRAAVHGAITNCETNRKPGSDPCEPINVNGHATDSGTE